MEKNINLAKILNGKPVNTKLWSPLFGDVYTSSICSEDTIIVVNHHAESASFYNNGKYFDHAEAEPLLFPSKEMRDWGKFAWKKGDLLINSCGFQCIFKEWASGDYTKFNGCYSNSRDGYEDVTNAETAKFDKLDNNIAYGYVREIERKLGGILNLTTLEIEKQYEFKDGDIAFADYGNRQDVFIVSGKTGLSEGYSSFISLDLSSLTLSMACRTSFFKKDLCELRLATEEEKKQLFSALEKKGKVWDSEHKMIVDLPKKCEFKPFDKVLGRNEKYDVWEAELFSHYREKSQYPFRCIGFGRKYCIPYNEETAHLLGTTDDWEGGEQ
jgi:hypothetical protein